MEKFKSINRPSINIIDKSMHYLKQPIFRNSIFLKREQNSRFVENNSNISNSRGVREERTDISRCFQSRRVTVSSRKFGLLYVFYV